MKLLNNYFIISKKFKMEIYRASLRKNSTKPTIAKLQVFLFINRKYPEYHPKVSNLSVSCPCKSWCYNSVSWNTLMHILNGNRRVGYKIAVWNCRKGLLLSNNSRSEKLLDIESLLHRHDLHLLGIVESDLHGVE